MASKDRAYYKAVRRATAAINSDVGLKQALDVIVRGTARAMKASVSLVLLDSTKTKLIHSSSWGLPQAYIRKGVLEADKSLAEVFTGQPGPVPQAGDQGWHPLHVGSAAHGRWYPGGQPQGLYQRVQRVQQAGCSTL